MNSSSIYLISVAVIFIGVFDVVSCRSMGPSEDCDDGKTNLTVDWDGSPSDYTCYSKLGEILGSNKPSEPIIECEDVPPDYIPSHICMDQKIIYDTPYPTHASHRPVWAKFGEYKYVPPQRWSHNVEHGSVVMLYHPCTKPSLVEKLRKIVTGCIRKHVITPEKMIPEETPLVLVTWGCRYRMKSVDEDLVKKYIKDHSKKGPEGSYNKDGAYTLELIKPAVMLPESENDWNVCPK